MTRPATWLARLRRFFEIVTTLIFAAIFVIFIYAVAMRYLLDRPVAWATNSTSSCCCG